MSLCMFVYYLLFSSNVNSIVYTIMYAHIYGYLVNIPEIRWVGLYLSPIEHVVQIPTNVSGHSALLW